MRYLGGKSRIAKQISSVILEHTAGRGVYVEPFIGAGSVAAQMAPHFTDMRLSDASPDLIALWQALQAGWQPPEIVSEEDYQIQRYAPVSALRGFVGYGCSFGGKWFGGYAKNDEQNDYCRASRNAVLRKAKILADACFTAADYQTVNIPNGSVVYLDPPYSGTTSYKGSGVFDSAEFWRWATKQSEVSEVFVSEYKAPADWRAVWQVRLQAALSLKDKTLRSTEFLWTLARD